MTGRLEGKVAIITGGASGMGAADARLFIEEGAKVLITDVNAEAGTKLAKELGENALFMTHDVASEEQWDAVVIKAKEHFGSVLPDDSLNPHRFVFLHGHPKAHEARFPEDGYPNRFHRLYGRATDAGGDPR